MAQYEAPANFGRGSKRLDITGYNVVITSTNGNPDTLVFTLQDPCSTLSNQCTAKAILLKVYKDYLEANGGTHVPHANDCTDGIGCDAGGPEVDFYAGTYTLVYTNPGVPKPTADLTVFVELPLPCDSTLEGVAYTTAAP